MPIRTPAVTAPSAARTPASAAPTATRSPTITTALIAARAPAVAALITAIALISGTASAQGRTPYEANEALEFGISTAAIAASALVPMLIFDDTLAELPCGDCDIRDINALDRPVTGYYSGTAKTLSDVALVAVTAAPFALAFADAATSTKGGGLAGFATDATILVETFAVQLAIVQVTKHLVRRARPLTYNPDADMEKRLGFDASLSFPSGHSSTVFAMATAAAITYQERHPNDPLRFAVWGGGMGLASFTALMRVSAGKHFWSDVLAGALIGTATGFVVPLIHLKATDSGGEERPASKAGAVPIMFFGVF